MTLLILVTVVKATDKSKPAVLIIPRADAVIVSVEGKQYIKEMSNRQILEMALQFVKAALERK